MSELPEDVQSQETIAVELPPEPDPGSVVLDGEGTAWQRRDTVWAGTPVRGWQRAGVTVPLFRLGPLPEGIREWPALVIEHGPLTVIYRPVPDEGA